MSPAEALAELKALTAWDKTPAIEEARLQTILLGCKVIDAAGYYPTADEWGGATDDDPPETPDGVYDLNLAAQRAWQEKAGNAASFTDFASDGERKDRSQLMRHCLVMAQEFKKKRASTVVSATYGRTGLSPWQVANSVYEDVL